MFVSAVIVAAGKGKRMGTSLNKVFLKINSKPIIYYTLKVFDNLNCINEIIIVISKDDFDYFNNEIIRKYEFNKKIMIVEGGEERQYSVFNGLKAVNNECNIVLIHDGARPFIDYDTVILGIEKAKKYKAVGIAVPVKDTIKVVDKDNMVVSTPDRKCLMAIQTPQIFDYKLIYNAHIEAKRDKFIGTDDSILVERLGYKVKLVEGKYKNIKITTPEDLIIAETLLNIN